MTGANGATGMLVFGTRDLEPWEWRRVHRAARVFYRRCVHLLARAARGGHVLELVDVRHISKPVDGPDAEGSARINFRSAQSKYHALFVDPDWWASKTDEEREACKIAALASIAVFGQRGRRAGVENIQTLLLLLGDDAIDVLRNYVARRLCVDVRSRMTSCPRARGATANASPATAEASRASPRSRRV